jgi:CRISPR/Cas system-associated exonuclease Cas4 (RecB family)
VKSIGNLSGLKDAKPQHKMQLQLYMFATKIREGLVLYVDKKNLKSKVFTIRYDEPEALNILERFSILHNYLIESIIPEPEAKINPEMSWMCRYCPYKEECDKADGVTINGKNKKD